MASLDRYHYRGAVAGSRGGWETQARNSAFTGVGGGRGGSAALPPAAAAAAIAAATAAATAAGPGASGSASSDVSRVTSSSHTVQGRGEGGGSISTSTSNTATATADDHDSDDNKNGIINTSTKPFGGGRCPSRYDWSKHMPTIKQLYIEEDKTLREVMGIMEKEHNFIAT
jgi:hypothetical protein